MIKPLTVAPVSARQLSSAEIVDLLSTPDIRAGAMGHLEAVRRYVQPGHGVELIQDQQFIAELQAQAADASATPGRRAEYPLDPTRRDDGSDWPGTGLRGERADTMLTPTDIVWLDRLSDDVAKITAIEARKVATLAADVPQDSTDQMIVDAVLQRIRDHYRLLKTDAELAAMASERAYAPPSNTVKLVAAALRRELGDGLTAQEIRRRAEEVIEKAVQSREAAREQRRAELTARMRELRFGVRA